MRIEGSSFEIGREPARLGSERHGSRVTRAQAGDRIREQRAYFGEELEDDDSLTR